MIQKLEIENFQSHTKSVLEFSPGVNAIIGSSDSGKTAILRAMRWVIENRPRGDAFRSFWGGKTSVKLTADDNLIERAMDKTTLNAYQLTNKDSDLLFTAMGTSVPEEIEKALNINPVNFQNQLDRPFLLDSSPGEVASHFNKIAHLDMIDTGLKNIKSWIAGFAKSISFEEGHLTELETEHSKYKYLDAMENEIKGVEKQQALLHVAHANLTILEKLNSDLMRATIQIEKYADLLSLESAVTSVLDLHTSISAQKTNRDSLLSTIEKTKRLDEKINSGKQLLNLEQSLSGVLVLLSKENGLQTEKRALSLSISTFKRVIADLDSWKKKAVEFQTEFDRVFPNICPLCNQEVKR